MKSTQIISYESTHCNTPAWGMWNLSLADRALWLFVVGRPVDELALATFPESRL